MELETRQQDAKPDLLTISLYFHATLIFHQVIICQEKKMNQMSDRAIEDTFYHKNCSTEIMLHNQNNKHLPITHV